MQTVTDSGEKKPKKSSSRAKSAPKKEKDKGETQEEKETQKLEMKTEEIAAEPKKKEPAGKARKEREEKPALHEDVKSKRPERYFEAVGRRKTATARVRLFTRTGDFTVNERLYADYFPTLDLQKISEDALKKMKLFGRFKVSVHVSGGGLHAQAEAVRHGLSRCLIKFNPDFRKRLKRARFLIRDPRMKERKKFGLKKARRAPQWAKR